MLHTPKHGAVLLILAIGLYLVDPVMVIQNYRARLAAGEYPVDADSIGIPIAQFLIGWILAAPFLTLLLWLALSGYRGHTSLFEFDHSRLFWSGMWTVSLGLLAGFNVLMAVDNFVESRNYFYVASYLLWTYILLCLRASVVTSKTLAKRRVSV